MLGKVGLSLPKRERPGGGGGRGRREGTPHPPAVHHGLSCHLLYGRPDGRWGPRWEIRPLLMDGRGGNRMMMMIVC
jgi:hypothetical protein